MSTIVVHWVLINVSAGFLMCDSCDGMKCFFSCSHADGMSVSAYGRLFKGARLMPQNHSLDRRSVFCEDIHVRFRQSVAHYTKDFIFTGNYLKCAVFLGLLVPVVLSSWFFAACGIADDQRHTQEPQLT